MKKTDRFQLIFVFQNDERNLVNQVQSQDKIIKYLKLRLTETESQMDEYTKIVQTQVQ